MQESESVQYFRFGEEGNMFVYALEAGFSGTSVLVQPDEG